MNLEEYFDRLYRLAEREKIRKNKYKNTNLPPLK